MPHHLAGQVILITGASSGIGAATAIACAQAGMDVALGARRVDRLEQVAQQIRQLGRQALVVACDVRQDSEVDHFVDQTLQTFGRLDVAFANAGYGLFASIMETTDEQARDMYETNFFGTLRVIKAAGRVMMNHGSGHLIICSSAASEIALPMYGLYASTKAAQDSIAGALRAEVAHHQVYVSTVHPVGTSSEFFQEVYGRSQHPLFKPNTPAALTQTPERIAKAVVKCIRKPCPEVWPSPLVRFGLALTTAFPSLAAKAMLRRSRRLYRQSS